MEFLITIYYMLKEGNMIANINMSNGAVTWNSVSQSSWSFITALHVIDDSILQHTQFKWTAHQLVINACRSLLKTQ